MQIVKRPVPLAWMGLIFLYIPLCYFAFQQLWGFDFASYYVASNELVHDGLPYLVPVQEGRPWSDLSAFANPNPPVSLWLFSFFSYFNFQVAFWLWLGFSTTLGMVGLHKLLRCICPTLMDQQEYWQVLLIYMASYPVMMNTIILQVGGVMLFFLAMGYTQYLKKQAGWTGFWWGGLIAIKLFPGLLVVYALLKKEFRLAGWLCFWFMCFSLFPLFFLEFSQYQQYARAITTHITWYGLNWSMSIMGFFYRVLVTILADPHAANQLSPPFNGGTIVLFSGIAKGLTLLCDAILLALWVVFFNRLEEKGLHKGFSCVLILMVLLSPLACIYYLPILLVPLLCTLNDANRSNPMRLAVWLLSVFCLCFPMPATLPIYMPSLFAKAGIYSVHFYGLLGLAYLTCTMTIPVETFTIKSLSLSVKQKISAITCFGLVFIVLRGIGMVIALQALV